jgi:predicted transcriptional regulator
MRLNRSSVIAAQQHRSRPTMDQPLRRPEEILAYRSLREILRDKLGKVWSVAPSDSVLSALQTMTSKNIGFLPVMEGQKLVGVLSERDCARRAAVPGKALDATPVSDIMVRNVVTVDFTRKFADCLRLMHDHAIRHLPVIDGGAVVAVVSIRDLLSEAVNHHAKIIRELERERMTMTISTA